MTDKEKMDAFLEGFNEGTCNTKPLTMDDVKKMSVDEINANWGAVKEAIQAVK